MKYYRLLAGLLLAALFGQNGAAQSAVLLDVSVRYGCRYCAGDDSGEVPFAFSVL